MVVSENKIKIRFNVKHIKWALVVCFFMAIVMPLFALGRTEDKTFIIICESSMSCLAIFSFVMLSIFPRLYYIFDEKGVSFQNRKGEERKYIAWDTVEDINYIFCLGFIPEGMEIKWKDGSNIQTFVVGITPKQARLIYDSIPQVHNIVGESF